MISTTGRWFPTKKKRLPLNGIVKHMTTTKNNGFHDGQWFPLKGMPSAKRNGCH